MKKFLLFASLGFSSLVFAGSRQRLAGLFGVRAPLKTIVTERVDLSIGHQKAKQSCYVFEKFVAVEIDSGQKGADSISVRKRGTKKDLAKICTAIEWKGEVQIEDSGYVVGGTDRLLITRAADPFGAEDQIGIYNGLNGELLYKANFMFSKDFSLQSAKKGKVSLSYYHHLKLRCSLAVNAQKCWDETRQKNEIPNSVEMGPPNCKKIFNSRDFKRDPQLLQTPEAVQIFVPVQIKNIANPQIIFQSGTAECAATP